MKHFNVTEKQDLPCVLIFKSGFQCQKCNCAQVFFNVNFLGGLLVCNKEMPIKQNHFEAYLKPVFVPPRCDLVAYLYRANLRLWLHAIKGEKNLSHAVITWGMLTSHFCIHL